MVDIVPFGDALLARTGDGRLHTWDGRTWSVASEATAISRVAAPLQRGGRRAVWAWRGHPPAIARFDGTWTEDAGVPGAYLAGVTGDDAGNAWVGGLNGTAWERRGDSWVSLSGLEGNLLPQADGHGGVWFWTTEAGGTAIHIRDGERTRYSTDLAQWSTGTRGISVDAEGRANFVTDAWFRIDEDGITQVHEAAPSILTIGATDTWGVLDGDLWHPATDRHIPIGAKEIQRVEVLDDGTPYVLADGAVFGLQDRATVVFRPRDVALPELDGATAVHGADIDGDGRTDLAVSTASGIDLYLQRDGAFPLYRRLVEGAWTVGAVCDLDGNGQDDIIARPASLTHGPWPMRMWRSLRGHEPEVTAHQPFALEHIAQNGSAIRCMDLDGDGDLDLTLASVGRGAVRRQFEWLRNDGTGHLRPVTTARRGLGGDTRWLAHALRGDLDNDGIADLVQLAYWGGGHTLLRGLPDGRLEDRSDGSGLRDQYDTPAQGWLEDVDGDGWLDLLISQETGMRAWRNRGDFLFDDATAPWGLDAFRGMQTHTALVDLDGDGDRDLLGRNDDQVFFALATEGGFSPRSESFPRLPAGVGLLPVDLDADGDLDVLPWGEGAAGALINRSERPIVTAPRWRSHGLWRRIAWLDGLQLGGLFAVTSMWLSASVLLSRRGSRVWLGHPLRGALTVGSILSALLWLVEWPGMWWWPLTLATAALAPFAGLWELRTHIWRTARRVGDYVLGPLLGRGGMGDVYLATSTTGDTVALKLVHPGLLARSEDRATYRREAEHGAAVDDPRVVRILGYGEWTIIAEGRPRPTVYLVMEYLQGCSLRTLLDERGPLDVTTAATLVREVALGLVAVHDAGLVHRDIKPDNVALTTDDAVKLMDFGAAQRVGQLTRTAHNVLGTLGYLSPEQARGKPPTPSTDIYATGVVLYELLAGQRPHAAATDVVAAITAILEHPVPALPRSDVPAELVDLMHRMMDPDPSLRPQSAVEVADALGTWAEDPQSVQLSATQVPLVLEHAAPTGHLRLLWRLVRRYLHYVREGGSPDLTVFALELLKPSPGDSTRPPRTTPSGTRPHVP